VTARGRPRSDMSPTSSSYHDGASIQVGVFTLMSQTPQITMTKPGLIQNIENIVYILVGKGRCAECKKNKFYYEHLKLH